ncbi:hypothetical protein CR513_00606, partial [Mucuna pruriens]
MVLKKVLPNARDPRGKWVPNYEGPYVVKHAFSGGALLLTDAEGHELKYPINTDLVKINDVAKNGLRCEGLPPTTKATTFVTDP